ncbi:CBS domain-containing protein [Sulfurospirillum sp. T05]|uniref:CBS domain-containing protein n=1 Tax=Sulfurospirillum tamanense TaxID=2813362 RepID=A0ABS2WPP2_9BACT|nr:CBS domain-containing protein [Sulfurospirillum tamanensis]
MLVEQIMRPNVNVIDPCASLKDALTMMRDRRVHSLIVAKSYEHDAYGIITNTQILQKILAEDGDVELINVYDIYSKPVFSVSAKIDIRHAAKLMLEHNIKRVAVTDNNELKGVLSTTDLTKYLISLLE